MSVSSKYAAGRGPGAITPDGCSVDLYSLLPPGRAEADVIASAAPVGGSVLELGAGAGRVTHCLLQRGLSVVAVDESAEMLGHIQGAETVRSTIEGLSLHRLFDVVVLGSHLVNLPSDDAVGALLQTCARHVAPEGHVLVERRDPCWFDAVAEMEVERGGIVYTVTDLSRSSPDVITATITYTAGDRSWAQTFTTRRVDDRRLEQLLAAVNLAVVGYRDDPRIWADAQRRNERR